MKPRDCDHTTTTAPPSTPAASGLVLVPNEITLNPYPERVTSLDGVRQHTQHEATRTRKSTKTTPQSTARRPFGASVLITIAAQGALAASIAAQQVSPAVGAVAAVGLLVGGLGLIVAELISVTGR